MSNRYLSINMSKMEFLPWLEWLSGLSANLQTKGLPVRFLVRAHDRSPGGSVRETTTHSPSLSPSLPLYLKINE